MAEGDLVEWLRRVPEITRYWFVGTVLLPILARFNVVKVAWFVLDYDLVVHHFQIWRPVTALFIYPITPQTGFQYLIMLYFLYNYSTRLETDVFPGRPADYLFMLIFNWFCAVIIGLALEMYFLLEPMVLSVLYVWCQHHAEMIVQFYFGTQFKAMYLPWILMLFNLILRGRLEKRLVEIVLSTTLVYGSFQRAIRIGYLYYFLTYRYPEEVGGESLLRTPAFLYRLFPSTHGGIHGFGRQPDFRRRRPQDDRGTHNWGHGHVLGGN
ncbi:der1 protein derlin [Trichuris trichiura]|uniref:Derlin n=1 Tax=Trichuris trichiura TaxID=36087 RepID=A0A077ZKZ0_TRITR|nr:der1 protein derlin [Trichuris trichiura]